MSSETVSPETVSPDISNRRPVRVVVTSKNPVKIEATRRGFARALPTAELDIQSLAVASGVADQPASDAETLRGARQRAETARRQAPDADYWIGLEGGLEVNDGELFAGAWIYVLGHQGHGRARTAVFPLPPALTRRLAEGLELGKAVDELFERRGSKRGPGAAGLLTDGAVGRTELYEPAVVLALIPLLKHELYGTA